MKSRKTTHVSVYLWHRLVTTNNLVSLYAETPTLKQNGNLQSSGFPGLEWRPNERTVSRRRDHCVSCFQVLNLWGSQSHCISDFSRVMGSSGSGKSTVRYFTLCASPVSPSTHHLSSSLIQSRKIPT